MKTTRMLLALGLLFALSATSVLAAPPGIPSSFYGTVRVSGASVPDGSIVIARIGGAEFGRAVVQQSDSLGSVYALNVQADDLGTGPIEGGRNGNLVTFVVQLPSSQIINLVQNGTWQQGVMTHLDLNNYSQPNRLLLPMIW